MKSESVVIVGSGGHAKVVIELIHAEGKYQIMGCTALAERGFVLGDIPILGDDSVLPSLRSEGVSRAFVAIGDNRLRMQLIDQLSQMGFEFVNAVSPHSVVSRSTTLGCGIAIMAGAVINSCAKVEDGAIINTGASVDHDCRIGRGAHVGPGSTLAGNVELAEEVFVGAGTTIIPRIRIGRRAIIGAGSVVIRDLPDEVTVAGVPARLIQNKGKISQS